jgi:hypothetical protein
MLLIVAAVSVTAKTDPTSTGLAPAPSAIVLTPQTPKTLDDVKALAFWAYPTANNGLCTFQTTTPGTITQINSWAPGANGFCTGAAMVNDGTLYMTDYDAANSEFWQVNPDTGDHTLLGTCGKSVHALTVDPTTDIIYAAGGVGNAANLYTVDPSNGALTLVGAFGGGLTFFLQLGCDSNGQLYGIDISTDNFYSIDKATGTATSIGSTGQSLNYAQDMAYSQVDSTMYVAGYTSSGTFFTADLTSGHLTTIGTFQDGAEIDALVIPGRGDTTPPVTIITLGGVLDGTTYITDVTITLTATDDVSGVDFTTYSLDGGSWLIYSAPIVVKTDGDHTFSFYSVDKRGNIENQSDVAFKIAHAITIVVKGGLGITATITNSASIAVDTTWKIKVDNAVVWVGGSKSSPSTVTIQPGQSIKAKDFVIGLGNAKITVTAFQSTKVVSAKIFLFFVSGVV